MDSGRMVLGGPRRGRLGAGREGADGRRLGVGRGSARDGGSVQDGGEVWRQFLRRRWKRGGIFYDGDGKNAVYIQS